MKNYLVFGIALFLAVASCLFFFIQNGKEVSAKSAYESSAQTYTNQNKTYEDHEEELSTVQSNATSLRDDLLEK